MRLARLPYTPKADQQIDGLIRLYEERQRIEAIHSLIRHLEEAEARVAIAPDDGLPAPRSYPQLARAGRCWLKSGPYWDWLHHDAPGAIFTVFHEAANIPGRL